MAGGDHILIIDSRYVYLSGWGLPNFHNHRSWGDRMTTGGRLVAGLLGFVWPAGGRHADTHCLKFVFCAF